MNNRLIIILIISFLTAGCAKNDGLVITPQVKSIPVHLSINSTRTADPLVISQDNTFNSMAIYVYNNDAGFTLERSVLLPSFSPQSGTDILIETNAGSKLIYIIANYANKTLKLTNGTPFTLSTTTTKQELENIIIENSSGFSPSSLLMVGKETTTVTQTDNGKIIDIVLRRLQARIDVHIYKGAGFASNILTLQSVTLHNKVLNSEIKFDYTSTAPQMLTSPMLYNQTISYSSILLPYVGGITLYPSDAKSIFYSYQNIVTQLSPLQTTAPYLEIKTISNGINHNYTGYFTDNNQLANKYSLLQNNVYQISAILDIDSKITLNMNILPWNRTNIEYNRPITANDFSFGAWGSSWGGLNGKAVNTNIGTLEDAVFQFTLNAPIGAAWNATLTNGLDFAFAPSTAGTTTPTVSSGFSSTTPHLISVRATKRWTGDARDTEFYITVEGKEIIINPVVGLQRKYEGTDTRIKITQVAASYN